METRPIPGIDPRYQATADGRIVSYMGRRPRVLSTSKGPDRPYETVSVLFGNGKRQTREVHSMVCAAFHGAPPAGHEASHRNGDSRDNRAVNLTWETHAENLRRKLVHGTHDRGFNNSRAVMTPEKVAMTRSLRERGAKHEDIAHRLGVSRTTVHRVLTGKRYA